MIVARRFLVRGRVQGVGFRYYAREMALLEGVVGFVRNLADGCVEAMAEGDQAAVVAFERAIRRGPPGGRVDEVETDAVDPTGASSFVIRA